MPIFVDEHLLTEVDPAALDRVIAAARRCTVDRYGVRPLDHFFDGMGRVHCIVEAVRRQNVRRVQAARS